MDVLHIYVELCYNVTFEGTFVHVCVSHVYSTTCNKRLKNANADLKFYIIHMYDIICDAYAKLQNYIHVYEGTYMYVQHVRNSYTSCC